jgi:DNA-binding Lrp family transcriptional regulator
LETLETPIPYRLSKEDIEILKLVDEGYYTSNIARKIGISKSKVSKRLKKFEKLGLIKRISIKPAFYELTDLGKYHLKFYDVSDVTVGRGVFVHNFRVVLGVVGVDVGRLPRGRVVGGQVSWRDGGFVFQLNGDRSVTVIFPGFYVRPWNLVGDLIQNYNYFLVRAVLLLRDKYGIQVNLRDVKVSSQEFHNWLPDFLRKYIRKEQHYELDKPAYSIVGYTDFKGSLWYDLTPLFGLETRDLDYEGLFAAMPFFVYHLYKYLGEYNKNIVLHLNVLKKMSNTLDKISMYFGGLKDTINYILENSLCLQELFKE